MVDMPNRGGFITLEGGEGAGKSTQARLLADRLEREGLEVVVTREPGGSPKAEAIRHVILSGRAEALGPAGEAMLFAAARIDHLDVTIRPALARGAFVICDRFADSTRVYQGALGEVPKSLIDALERVAVGATRPDLTLLLDIPPEIGMARAAARRGAAAADRFERADLDDHRKLRQAFLDLAAAEPERFVVIDATQAVADIAAAIWTAVEARLLAPRRARTQAPA